MSVQEVVRVESANGLVRAVIDRPDARNAINHAVIEGLLEAVEEARRSSARVLVVQGAGGTFCSGADLSHIASIAHDAGALERFVADLSAVLDALYRAPFATVAVVEGHALAGGCELLLACDIALAAENAELGDRHLAYGLVPGAGGSVRLARSLAHPHARYLLLTGAMISGATAAAWGLVTQAVPHADLQHTADELLALLAGRGGDALAVAKAMIADAEALPFDEALLAERRRFLDHLVSSPEVAEGLDAFAERRPPVFNQRKHREH